MCWGVTNGLAFEKLSGSLKMSGKNETIISNRRVTRVSMRRSLYEWYGWNGILSMSGLVPSGLLDPSSCSRMMCNDDKEIIANGKMKCNAKNRVRVGSLIAKPPHNQVVSVVPKYGTAVSRLVITVAAQNDICPHGRTYPKKAVAIKVMSSVMPDIQVSLLR